MKTNRFKQPKSVIKGTLSALAGVIFYCAVVAPVFKEGSYTEVVSSTFSKVGIGLGVTIIFTGAAWLGALKIKKAVEVRDEKDTRRK